MLVEKGLELSSHDAVKTKFGEVFAKTRLVDPKFGRMLSRPYQLRLDAQYDIDTRSEIAPGVAESQFQSATEFLSMAEDFLKGAGGKSEER